MGAGGAESKTANGVPVANAGEDVTFEIGSLITLTGELSADPDGDELSYEWILKSAPEDNEASFDDPFSIRPNIRLFVPGEYLVQLTVSDGQASHVDTVSILLLDAGPVADAGLGQTVPVGTTAFLSGADSYHLSGSPIRYTWSLLSRPDGSLAELSDSLSLNPSFTPDVAGEYRYQLIVSDQNQSSSPSFININTENSAPVAVLGPAKKLEVGTVIDLNGGGSFDIDGDEIVYHWSLVNTPEGSSAELNSVNLPTTQFTADLVGDYRVQLVVSDPFAASKPAIIDLNTNDMRPLPLANAGLDQFVTVSEEVLLSGERSFDPEGESLEFNWALIHKPAESLSLLSSDNKINTTFVTDVEGDYIAQLTVTDKLLVKAVDTVHITTDNTRPVAIIDGPVAAKQKSTLLLSAAASNDANHDELHYSWSLIGKPIGSTATFDDESSIESSFIADMAGHYTVQLVVDDGKIRSTPDTLVIQISANDAVVFSSFDPLEGAAGTKIRILGENLGSSGAPHVYLGESNSLPVSYYSSDSIDVTLPPGYPSGPLTLRVGDLSLQSSLEFNVIPKQDFQITINPTEVKVFPGQEIQLAVELTLNSGEDTLDSAVNLSVESLPEGVAAEIRPSQIRPGDTAILTLKTSFLLEPGALNLVLNGSSIADGAAQLRSKAIKLTIAEPSTAFIGKVSVDDAEETPLEGVVVTFLGKDDLGNSTSCNASTTVDAAGNFHFSDLPDTCLGTQLVRFDGSHAISGNFADVDKRYFITKNGVETPPVPVHLPSLEDAEIVFIKQRHDKAQFFAFKSVPGLSIIIYPGTTITKEDGSTPDPFPMYLVEIQPDRLPGETPQDGNLFIPGVVAFQPANTSLTRQMAVIYPNSASLPSGTAVDLMTLDPTKGIMKKYGTGKVSLNGRQIMPDEDPAQPGERYGLYNLDWHGPRVNLDNDEQNVASEGGTDDCTGSQPRSAEPIDFATGIEVVSRVDLSLACNRGGITLVRTYRSQSDDTGPFGTGTNHNYGYRLDTANPQDSDVFNLIMPNGNRIPISSSVMLAPGDGFAATGSLSLTTSSTSARITGTTARSPRLLGSKLVFGGDGLTRLTWKNGTVFEFTADPALDQSFLTGIVDSKNNRISIERDPSQPFNVTTVKDPVGRAFYFEYDSLLRITKVSDSIGRSVSYNYEANNLALMTDVLGNEIRYEYDGQRLISEINARGIKQMVNTYDSAGRVIEQRFADGGEWRYEYTLSNASVPSSPVRETAVTDPLGQKTVYRFNINGFLISVVDALGQTTSFERASESNLLIRKRGNAVCAVCGDASIEVTEYEYDDLGNTRKIRQLNDSLDRSLAVVHSEVSMTFGGAFNKLQSVTDPLGNSFTLDYDFEGNVSQTEDALGRKSYFNHDSQGLLQSVTDALGNKTSYRYDTFSNLISEADAEGNENVIRYDGVSRPVEIVDALGNSTVLQYDAAGRVNSLTNANDETIRFEYDSLGNRTAVIDARGLRTSFEYNTMNRVSKRTDSLGNSDLREYDLVGNLIHYTDREGQKSSYEYDALYRLSKVTYADGESTQYAYSTRSQLVEVVDSSSGVYQYQYDARGMLSEVLTPTGKVSYSYNRRGDMISRQVQGQEAVAYDYDAVGNLTRVSSGGVWLQFQYDELNQVVSVSRSNNVDTNYSYTNRGQISSISHTSFGREISKQEYIYDSVGNRIQYDTLLLSPQLTAAATYDIDPASNRLLRRGDVLYSYDKNGNRSREENIKTGEAKSYEWDARNRLIALIESGGESTAFSYDFAGNLIRKTRTTPEATREITYVLDVYSNIVAVIDSDGDSFGVLTGQTLDSHLAILRESKQQFPLVDAINSTVATTNEMGVIEAEFHYEAFGENSSGETEFSFQFTGRQAIGDGLYYYRARFYDSKTGSFISQDPIGFSSGELNLYGYVGNSPHNFNDPTGNFYQVLLIPGRIVISSAIAGFQQGVADYLTTPGSHDRKLRNALGGFASAFREGLKTGVFGEPLVAAYNLISDVNDQLKEYKQRCGRAGFDVTNLRNLFYKYLPGKIVNAPQNKARGKYQKLIVQSALNNIFSYMSELISER